MRWFIHILGWSIVATAWQQHPFRSPDAGTRALEAWIDAQDKVSQARILANIAPFASDVHALPGAVCASPSRQHPDYYYTWTRDSGLVMLELMSWLEHTDNHTFRRELEQRMNDYAEFTRHVQGLKHLKYGLGEAKFHMDGTPFRGSWCNAQTDGPAIRARALLRYISYRQHEHKTQNNDGIFDLVRTDLDFVHRVWRQTGNCDIWEESRGVHYYTMLAHRRALADGAQTAHTLGHHTLASIYEHDVEQITLHLREFWDTDRGYIVATLNKTGGIRTKHSNLDSQVLLAVLHHGTDVLATREVMATVGRLVREFGRLYVVNQVQRTQIDGRWVAVGAAVGRYPEDVYNGDGTSRGNPWTLVTSSVAEYHYRLALEIIDKGGRATAMDIWSADEWLGILGAGDRPASSYELAAYLLGVGDRYMSRVCRHTDGDHTMYEQWDRRTGFGRGAVHLTWSYAAHMSASRWRAQLVARLV